MGFPQAWLVFALTFFVPLCRIRLDALDPGLRLSQYGHTAWRVREGYFSSPLLAIAQTTDGQLWIGGEGGLVRFDGVHFLPSPAGMDLPNFRIFGLLGASDGSLWVGIDGGLARWKDGKLTVYSKHGRFSALLQDRHGTVWAGHTRDLDEIPPLCSFAAGEFKCFRVSEKFPLRYVGSLHEDLQGNLWVGGEGAVCLWHAETPDCYEIPGPRRAEKFGVYGLARDSKGEIWADAGPSGVWRLVSGHWQPDKDFPGVRVESEAMLSDREGSLWIGDVANGIIRRVNGRVDRFTQNDGLSGNGINKVFEDREGNVWVATSGGLDRFRDLKVATLTPHEELPLDSVWSVASSSDGGLWISGIHTLVHMNKEGARTFESGRELPGKNLSDIFEDHRGRLWVGIGNKLLWTDHDRFHEFRLPKPCDHLGQVTAMTEEAGGTLWVSTTIQACGLIRIQRDQVVEVFSYGQLGQQVNAMAPDPAGGIWLGVATGQLKHYREGHFELRRDLLPHITNIFADTNGLWLATDKGLILYSGNKLAVLNSNNGLPCDFIEAAIEDDHGSLWLKSPCALVQVSAIELTKWLNDPGRRIELHVLDAFDGVQSGFSPWGQRATKSADGRLWFAVGNAGLQVVVSSHVVGNAVPPPVQVLGLVADHRVYEVGSDVQLPALTKTLEISYTAYSLSVPEKVRFRYKLDGYESEWSVPVSLREVRYTNLPPRNYEFRVMACNNDGVWNETGAGLAFAIPPAFTQRVWFKVVCLVGIGACVYAAYRLRVQQVSKQLRARMHERLAERYRIAQELHDTLLQSFQGLMLRFEAANEVLLSNPSQAKEALEGALTRADEALSESRKAIQGIRSDSHERKDLEHGLRALMNDLAEELRLNEGKRPTTSVIAEGQPQSINPWANDEICKIAREALRNSFSHAKAQLIESEITYNRRFLRVRFRDDGVGIDPAVLERGGRKGHWGLTGMRERTKAIGGRLVIWSKLGMGTEVEVTIPASVAFDSGPWRGLFRKANEKAQSFNDDRHRKD